MDYKQKKDLILTWRYSEKEIFKWKKFSTARTLLTSCRRCMANPSIKCNKRVKSISPFTSITLDDEKINQFATNWTLFKSAAREFINSQQLHHWLQLVLLITIIVRHRESYNALNKKLITYSWEKLNFSTSKYSLCCIH